MDNEFNLKTRRHARKLINNNKRSVMSLFCCLIISFILVFITIGFSAFDNRLNFHDTGATVRIDKDIRITGIELYEASSGVVSLSEDYNSNNVITSVNLVNSDSYIIYKVKVTNLGNVEMGIFDIICNNSNLDYELVNFNLKSDKICDNSNCINGIDDYIYLKIKYKDGLYNSSNTVYNYNGEFDFREFYTISYSDLGDTSSYPTSIMSGDNLVIDFGSYDTTGINVSMGGLVLVRDVGYTLNDNILRINDVSGNISLSCNNDYLEDTYPDIGSNTTLNDLVLTSLGNGMYMLNGTTTEANTYVRLSYDLAMSNAGANELIDGSTILESGSFFNFSVDQISGSYSGITDPAQMRVVIRGVGSATASKELGYDFVSGYIGERTGILKSSIGMISYWFTASETRPVTFDNFVFKVNLTDSNPASEGKIKLKTVENGGLTVEYYNDGMYVVNGTSTNSSSFLALNGVDMVVSGDKNVIGTSVVSPTVSQGESVTIYYQYVANAPNNGTKAVTINFRDATSAFGAVNSIKLLAGNGSSGTPFSLTDTDARVSGTMPVDASALSMYFAPGITFVNYSFYAGYEK